MSKIAVVFGTRPEAIKMAPLIKVLQAEASVETTVIATAQHREMLDQVLSLFDITPNYDLNIMTSSQTLEQITSRVLEGMADVLKEAKPDIVLVQGDTTTTCATALAAFYQQIPIGHVEAGLRTNNIYSPFPEEINRKLTTTLTSIHFAPTELNKANLLAEGVCESSIFVTGNTVIDALKMMVRPDFVFDRKLQSVILPARLANKRLILMTCHRRENWGRPMREIFSAVRDVVGSTDKYELMFPVHLNSAIQKLAHEVLGDIENVHLIAPLEYAAFSNLMSESYLLLSDSGGVQEEAPSLGKPVLVLRNITERPEALAAGTVRLAGNTYDSVRSTLEEVLHAPETYSAMVEARNPYGDGASARRIAESLFRYLSSNNG